MLGQGMSLHGYTVGGNYYVNDVCCSLLHYAAL